jgi:hypothetical protein
MLKTLLVLTAAVSAIVLPSSRPSPSQISIRALATAALGARLGGWLRAWDNISPLASLRMPSFNSLCPMLNFLRFKLMFSQFAAQISPTTQPIDSYKFCQINPNLHYPYGFRISILSTESCGYVGLDSGVIATLGALYYFSGRKSTSLIYV